MLHDPESGHTRQHLAQLVQGLAVLTEQRIQQLSTPRIGQGSKDQITVTMHAGDHR